MKTLEFKASIAQNGHILVPPQIAEQIPEGETIQIVLAWETHAQDDAWKSLARQKLEAAYAPEDAIYELLDR